MRQYYHGISASATEKHQLMTFAAEILLLALDDDPGNLQPCFPLRNVFNNAIAGAMLLELAFGGHIDSDLQHVFPVEKSDPVAPHLEKVRDTLSLQPE